MTLDLDTFLVALYTLVDDLYQEKIRPLLPKRPGPPGLLTDSELLTLALLCHWGVWKSERAFLRWAHAHLMPYFPSLGSQSRFNRRVRHLWCILGMLYRQSAQTLASPSPYRVMDPTPVPVCKVVRWRKSPFRGKAAKSWCAAKKEWYFGFKLFLSVTPDGVITSAALLPANVGDRPGAEEILCQEQHPCYLADKGFCSPDWERVWLGTYNVNVLTPPYRNHQRAWPEEYCRKMSGLRQIVEVVAAALKGTFRLEQHGAKTDTGLWARTAAKLAAYSLAQRINKAYHRPLMAFATLCSW